MKILYIDPESFLAHKNYNKIQLGALEKITKSISVCFKEGYVNELDNDAESVLSIPNCLYKKSSNPLFSRIMMLIRYWFIILKLFTKFKKYDVIIIAYYDELPLLFAPFPKNSYLINHVNIYSIYRSRLKRFFFKLISKRYHQVVMDEMSENYLRSIKIKKIRLIRHGLIEPFTNLDRTKINKKIIFCPSARSVDSKFVQSIIEDKEFIKILNKLGYQFIVKGHYKDVNQECITIIDRFIPESEYQEIFLSSCIILLPYDLKFKYRSSGVLFEAITNKKIIIARDIPALLQYKKYYKYIYGFSSIPELLKLIADLSSTPQNPDFDNFQNLNPDYSFLLKKTKYEKD